MKSLGTGLGRRFRRSRCVTSGSMSCRSGSPTGREDGELMKRATALLTELEQFQQWMAGHFGLDDDDTKMHEKKAKTSFMRRFAPEGLATGLVWTANIRTLRHTIEARTDQGAEEEIRLVFGKIAALMRPQAPALFGDYTVTDDGTWVPGWRKV